MDAVVFCDCVERGRLKTPHPFSRLLYIDERGAPEIRSRSQQKIEMHDAWVQGSPCGHETLMIAGDYLGNISLVDYIDRSIRERVPNAERKYPVLMSKVIFNGGHTGDYLTVEEVKALKKEITEVRGVNFSSNATQHIRKFLSKLEKIADASLRIRKPMAF